MRDLGPPDVDERLHDTLVGLLFESGAQHLDWLVARARKRLRDARVDEDAVIGAIEASTLIVSRPTGLVDHALGVVEGDVFTHRVRSDLAGRRDLWLGTGSEPLPETGRQPHGVSVRLEP